MNKIVDIVTNQIGIRIVNVQPENQYAIIAKKRHFVKGCKLEHRKWQEKKITEAEETWENETETDKSIIIITEMKHVID